MEDREVDPVIEGYDVVVRLNPEPDSALVGRCFVRDQLLIVAAPSFAVPSNTSGPPDGEPVPVVVRSSMRNTAIWQISGPEGREIHTRPVLQLPSLPMVRDAVITGIGAAKLPRVLVAEDVFAGRLACWGPSSDRPAEIWALHASSRFASAKGQSVYAVPRRGLSGRVALTSVQKWRTQSKLSAALLANVLLRKRGARPMVLRGFAVHAGHVI